MLFAKSKYVSNISHQRKIQTVQDPQELKFPGASHLGGKNKVHDQILFPLKMIQILTKRNEKCKRKKQREKWQNIYEDRYNEKQITWNKKERNKIRK